jgi:hypothetical protein
MNLWLYFEYAILITLIITFIIFYDIARKEKDAYDECNKKILCENGKLPKQNCLGYDSKNETLNITF